MSTTATKEKDREALMAGAAEIIARHGVENVGLDEVAREAKIDPKKAKAIYPDLASLVDDLVRRELDESAELFTKVVNDRGKADIKLTRLVRELLTRYQGGYSVYHLVSANMEHAPADDALLASPLAKEHLDRYRHNTAILGRLIAQGQSENLFTDVDPLEAAYLLRGMIRSALMYRRIAGREGDMRDTADVVMRVFLKGLLR